MTMNRIKTCLNKYDNELFFKINFVNSITINKNLPLKNKEKININFMKNYNKNLFNKFIIKNFK